MPYLNKTLSRHHEMRTAMVLTTLENWKQHGMTSFYCSPVMNWSNPGDKHINNGAAFTSTMHDAKGNFYYVAQPPFAFYLPYFIFKLFLSSPNLLGLQCINMFLHFLSAFFTYLIVGLLCIKKGRSRIFYPAFIAFCVYLFNPATLWFQGNVYMSDMLAQAFFVILTYITLKMLMREKFNVPKYIFWYALVLSMMCFTSWLGTVFALVIIVYSTWKLQFVSGFKTLIAVTVCVVISINLLTFYTYSQIAGSNALLHEWTAAFMHVGIIPRGVSGLFANIWALLLNIKNILYNYLLHYNLIYLWLIGIFIFVMSRKKSNFIFTRNGYRFLILSGFTILCMHILLLGYSRFDYTILYGSLLLSVLVGVLFHKILFTRKVKPRWINVSIISMCCLMVVEFWIMNFHLQLFPAKHTDKYARAAQDKEAVLCTINDQKDILFCYKYKRNFYSISSEKEIVDFLNQHQIPRAIIIDSRYPQGIKQIAPTDTIH